MPRSGHAFRTPLAALALLLLVRTAHADVPPPPEAADFRLIGWDAVVEYCKRADEASDRVVVRELGETTEGRPYLAAIVSSEETIRDLERFRSLQASLVDPDTLDDPGRTARAVAESKVVVLITCSIHSSETASTFMALRLLRDLAASDDPATKEILDKVILLLVPSANPDGVQIVADWYDRSKGKPWEGSGLPRLYHKYAGHDTNRDWFMLNLRETQLLTRLLYREWFPTITYDVHQMGSKGPRLFVPPFHDPINPNLDPRLHQGIAMIGSHMAFDLASAGKRGVASRVMYDNWWNGGNRTTPQRHNMVGILTEAASVRLATPLFLDKEDLGGGGRGFGDHKPSVDFVDPWPGGWWRLSDIAEYEAICARSLLTLAARYKDTFQRNYAAMNRDTLDKGRSEPPFAWVVPADQRDPGTAAEMVRILHETGVRVRKASGPFRAAGREFPAGSWVLPAAQPYRNHLKDMMERQVYPERLDARGTPEPPYDVAGWTLPLLMGVEAVEVAEPFEAESEAVEEVERPRPRIDEGPDLGDDAEPAFYELASRSNDDFLLVNALLARGGEVSSASGPGGGLRIEAGDALDETIRELGPRISTRLIAHPRTAVARGDEDAADEKPPLRPARVGLYQPWVPSMDEGWTRLVLEKFRFPYESLHNADIRAGNLSDRIDVLLIPSVSTRTLREGYAPDETEPAYVGGLGREGAASIREFVRDGGSLVCLEDSCLYALEELDLPVKEVTRDLKSSEFYGPGSLVRVSYQEKHPLTLGMPPEGTAYFDRSLAFEPKEPNRASSFATVAKYAENDLLQSGWLLGPQKIAGRAALVEIPHEKGRVVLFGFPPQHRGQTHGTFRLLFQALRVRGD
jgi:hypothetical protein